MINPSEDCESLRGNRGRLRFAGVALHFKIPEGYTLTLMLITTLASDPDIAQNYGWATVGFYYYRSVYPATIVVERRTIYSSSASYRYHYRSFNCFRCTSGRGGSGQPVIEKRPSEAYQEAICLNFLPKGFCNPRDWPERMRVNQAHNTLYNSLNQAMRTGV